MNRRSFIASTGTFALAAPWVVRAAENPRIRIGFLGASHSHALGKWRELSASADYEIVGICEESPTARESFQRLGAKLLSREELFERCEVIAVESPVRAHARDAKLALEAAKHVHVEKPPAATLRECDDLAGIAREKKLFLQTGYMWRFHPAINRVIEAAKSGWLGEVFLVRAQINTQLDTTRRSEWAEFKGGAMFELGCLLVDAIVRLLGKPRRVTPHLQRRGNDDLADNCLAVFEFPKAHATITSSVLQPNAPSHRFFEVAGTNGTAIVRPLEPPSLEIDLAKAAGPYKAGLQKVELPPYRRYVAEFAELALCIRERKPLSTSLDTELLVQETLLRASDMI